MLYNKLHDIVYIYDRFEHYLRGRYIDTEDYMNLVVEKMNESQFLKEAEIWIDGFYKFTPQNYRIIEKLMILTKGLSISFPIDFSGKNREGDLFKVPEAAFEEVQDIAMKYGIPGEIVDLGKLNKNSANTPEMKHIQQEFYAYPYKAFEEEIKNIYLFEALNTYTEIENAAIKIVSLVRERGYRWRDIAIVTNDMESYGPLIERVLNEHEIPFFMDYKRSVMHNPIIEFLLSSLEVVLRGYRYEEMFRFLKTGFGGVDTEKCEKLENYALKYGVRGHKRWKEEFTSELDKEKEVLEELNKVKEKFMAAFVKLEKGIKGKKTVEEITRSLYDFLDDMQIQTQLEEWIDQLREKGRYEYVYENTQIWNILMEMLDQLVEILGENQITLKEYIRILEAGFLSLEIAIIPTAMDQVLVGSIQRSKSHDIKALFIVGTNDGILPSSRKEEGILSDEERLYLTEKGVELASDRERKACEEKFMIYDAFSKPSEYLWVSYAVADGEGKAMRRSILIDRLLRLFTNIKIQSDITYDGVGELNFISTPKGTFKYLVENIRRSANGESIEPIWWNVYDWYYSRSEWDEKRQTVLKGLFHDNQVFSIYEEDAKKIYNLPIRSSISRLEMFSRCPFAHFVQYALSPKDREVFQIYAPDVGEIFHRCIEMFTQELKKRNIDWKNLQKEQCYQIMDEVIDEIVPVYRRGVLLSTHRYLYLINRLKRIGKRAIWTLTDHIKRGSFEPLGNEIRFGIGQFYPPIKIELPDGETVYLEGRIDRVDILEDEENCYIKIIDYKSGSKDFSLSDIYYGLQVQLIVYLDAILTNQNKLTTKEVKPAGVFYFKIDDPLIKTEEKVIEVIEKEIRKELKMKGLVLKDAQIVRKMDCEIEGHSEVIPVGLKKNGEFYSNSSAVADEEFASILKHVRKLLQEITYEILKGNIAIRPVKVGKRKACDFCDYHSICQFDSMFEGNSYQNRKILKDYEVMKRINKERK
jgi:ATP-dependent helicase/nuclease subunit B